MPTNPNTNWTYGPNIKNNDTIGTAFKGISDFQTPKIWKLKLFRHIWQSFAIYGRKSLQLSNIERGQGFQPSLARTKEEPFLPFNFP